MVIETKYDLGDKAFVLYNNKIYVVIVTGITINVESRTTITYKIRFPSGGETELDKSRLFSTKEELIETL